MRTSAPVNTKNPPTLLRGEKKSYAFLRESKDKEEICQK